jgi:hypothetical protein
MFEDYKLNLNRLRELDTSINITITAPLYLPAESKSEPRHLNTS